MNDRLAVELPSGNETVLVAEWDLFDREWVAWLLDLQGYKVLRASNGIEALVLSKEYGVEDIDLLLTGIQMPGMGGKDLARLVRLARPNIKVLFTAEKSNDAAIGLGASNRALGLVPKPFNLAELAVTVRQVLDGCRTTRREGRYRGQDRGAHDAGSPARLTHNPALVLTRPI